MHTFDRHTLGDLVGHVEWADAEVWNAVLAAPRAHDDVGIRDYLHHIHMVQRMFCAMWRRESPETIAARQPSEFTLSELRAWSRPFYDEARAFLETVSQDGLAQTLDLPWATRLQEARQIVFARPTVAETVFQVVNHSTHHRAQVSARLRAAGGEPPLVDYIAWVWFGRPSPRHVAGAAARD